MDNTLFPKKTMSELGRLSADENIQSHHFPIQIVLDDVRSMNNVGSVFRTADALNVAGIILCGYTPTPPHRDIPKTALGATESVPWTYEQDIRSAIASLREQGYIIIGVEQTHNSIYLHQYEVKQNHKMAFIFGNEINGVSDTALALCDTVIEIPQWGAK